MPLTPFGQSLPQFKLPRLGPFGLTFEDEAPAPPAAEASAAPNRNRFLTGTLPPLPGRTAEAPRSLPPLRRPGQGQEELDAIESRYNEDPFKFMAESGDKGGGLAARRAELEAQGMTEFAPGQGYKGPPLKGGGTVSMMTAPENAARVTSASRMEDLGQELQERRMLAELGDPLGIYRQEAEARMKQNPLDLRRSEIVDGLAELESGLAAKVAAGEMTQEEAEARLKMGRERAERFAGLMRPGQPEFVPGGEYQ